MATASPAPVRTRLTSFRDAPALSRPRALPERERSRARRYVRRGGVVLLTLLAVLTFWFTMATPAQAGWMDDIGHICGPVNVPAPEYRGKGMEAFLGLNKADSLIDKKETETYIPKADEKYHGPGPSFHRYGMASLTWNTFGESPGCFDMNRYVNFVPNMIFNVSKTFAAFTMALVGWSFGSDPFSFLNEPIGNIAKAMSNVAGSFLGLVGVLGAVYLGLKNWGPNGRLTAVFKGVGWMALITGLFFWFAANPTALGSKVNSVVGQVTSTGFQSLSKLPQQADTENDAQGQDQGETTNTRLCNGSAGGGNGPAACVQDRLWWPLVYQPWLYGQVGNSGDAAGRWGPEMLNAQFVGTDAKGNIDPKGADMVQEIEKWNGDDDEVGGPSKTGSKAWDGHFVDKVPFLKLWANDLCHEKDDENLRVCWGKDTGWWSNDERQVSAEDESTLRVASGQDFASRLSAAGMSVMGGLIINASVYFVCAMLLAAKLGVFVLMVFAPFYLLMGIFPGPSRVAAIKLGELILANVFRQVGWSLGLVIITYMDTLILAPGGHSWVLKILTCGLMTVMFGVYARPALRALSGMAMGDKEAGGAIEGVGADLAQKTGKAGLALGLAAATGGASAAMAVQGAGAAAAANGERLSFGQGLKAAGSGLMNKMAPDLLEAKGAGAGDYEEGDARRKRRQTDAFLSKSGAAREGMEQRRRSRLVQEPHEAAQEAIQRHREYGDVEGADAMEKEHFQAMADPRTGAPHADDPRAARVGTVNPYLNVRRTVRGSELAAQGGIVPGQESANVDRVAHMYGGAANIDPFHPAAPALRSYAMHQAAGSPISGRQAAEAVARHGVPDRIDTVGMPSNARVAPDQMPRVGGDFHKSAPTLVRGGPQARMEFLTRLEGMARQVPVGTPMSTAMNELRGIVADPQSTEDTLTNALRAVQQAQGR